MNNPTNTSERIFSNVSHELRTPLNGILGYARMGAKAVHGGNSDKAQECFDKITACARQLAGRVDDLLNYAQPDDSARPQIKKNDMRDLVNGVVLARNAAFREKDIHVTMTSAPDGRSIVYCDGAQVCEILIKLLDNAISYSPPHGQVSIHVTPVIHEHDAMLETMICDEGHGITDEAVTRLFIPFEEGQTTQSNAGGWGMGLAICQKIVNRQLGRIYVNKTKSGNCIAFTLPMTRKRQHASHQGDV